MHLTAAILAIVSVLLVGIARVYRSVPAVELKRRARNGDQFAEKIYKIAGYGTTSQTILWLLTIIVAAIFFVLVAKDSPVWLSFILDLALVWVIFIWLPRNGLNGFFRFVAVAFVPIYSYLLKYLYPVFKHTEKYIDRLKAESHTGIYEKRDLAELLLRQSKQPDNRIDNLELDLLTHALSFNDKKISDVLLARKKVIAVSLNDTIGPIILSDAYKAGQTYIPVYEGKKTNIVGILEFDRAKDMDGKTAGSFMNKQVMYIHEQEYLSEALSIITKTHCPLFVVINEFEEYVGIVSNKNILTELTGSMVIDEIDNYGDPSLVAKKFAKPEQNPTKDTE